MFKKTPKLIRLLLIISFVQLLFFTILRLIFFISFSKYSADYSYTNILYAFFIGFRFDLQLIVILNLPILILGNIKYINIFSSNLMKYIWIFYIASINIIVLIIYIINFAYYDFFKKMVNGNIIRYFYDFQDAFKMVQEDYPVYNVMFFFFIFIFIVFKILNKLINLISLAPIYKSKRFKIIVYTLFVPCYIFMGYGKVELYPWRWSEAFFSSNNFISYLASNPITYFSNTLGNTGIKYDEKKTKKYYHIVSSFLDLNDTDPNLLSLARIENNKTKYNFNKPNIIFVLSESLSYCRTNLSGNPLNPTPFLDKLSKKSLTYENYFTPHAGTARSVWAAMTGIPDIQRISTSSRNPIIVKQNMILNSLKDYKKYYFIGGSLSWGNVRGVIGNVEGIITKEESDYNSAHNDVWGISDIDLFREANSVFTKEEKPFFAFIQLSGNHSPNTIPENSYGFKTVYDLNKDDLLKYSFDGKIKEFNAQRFMDHSIEHFFLLAKKEKYFNNTVFIFVGDHGLSRQCKHMHSSYESHVLTNIHTPLIIYSPNYIKHKKISYPVSEIDIMPTIAGISGNKYVNSTFGRNILDENFDDKDHYAFSIINATNPTLRLIGSKFIYMIKVNKDNPRLYKRFYKNDEQNINLIDKYPAIAKKMRAIVEGLYENIRYTRYHNSTQKVKNYLQEK